MQVFERPKCLKLVKQMFVIVKVHLSNWYDKPIYY